MSGNEVFSDGELLKKIKKMGAGDFISQICFRGEEFDPTIFHRAIMICAQQKEFECLSAMIHSLKTDHPEIHDLLNAAKS